MDVFTFGETMIRLSPPGAQRMEGAAQFNTTVGGSESNVAVALARLGKSVMWFSHLPDNPLGHSVTMTLRGQGVDCSMVRMIPGERMGLYFLETGSAPRAARVLYDRAGSAASKIASNVLPWESIRVARWLHVTGITPALSQSCAEAIRAALTFAKGHGIHTSFDVNYRALLWTPDIAAEACDPLCKLADTVFIAARDAVKLFGERDPAALRGRWGGTVIVTNSAEGASGCDESGVVSAQAFPVVMVDRLGAGDAFAAGGICRLLEGAPLENALRFGCATAALKLTIPGDLALISRQEVDTLVENAPGAIVR